MKHRMAGSAWMVLLPLVLGCGEARPEPVREQPPLVPSPSCFDPASAGAIRGTVRWTGDLPNVPPFEISALATVTNPSQPRLIRDNPHTPNVDSATKGVVGAVVFLRKADPRMARPWDHPPITIVHEERRLEVLQGDIKSRVGFVHRGSAVTMVSREKVFNSLHAGGAAFFTLTFPEPDQPLTRLLKDAGLVELTSAAGCYWMRGYLFVDDHPYFARTGDRGEFELAQVPPGRYQIVCWMPNWNKKSQDLDPESGLATRMFFHTPLELEQEVVVESSGGAQVDFVIRSDLFRH